MSDAYLTDEDDEDIRVVMTIAGLDPSGGAGLSADIEAIASQGCHPAPVASCITVQDTVDVQGISPLSPELLIDQARTVLEDMPVHAVKLGLLPNIELITAVHGILVDYPDIPVILDPVLSAGGGRSLTDAETVEAMRLLLVPLVTLLTPNSHEARLLAPEADDLDACGMTLLEQGAQHVLITGTHEVTAEVHNVLYGGNRILERYTWPRLEGEYHGSGCTLASAAAGLLAQGETIPGAVQEAQEYTWQALQHGYRLGMGQLLPSRLFWTEESQEYGS
jgi:hydroxymethylpyrimidine/phosphomethylpyrimidine kinase